MFERELRPLSLASLFMSHPPPPHWSSLLVWPPLRLKGWVGLCLLLTGLLWGGYWYHGQRQAQQALHQQLEQVAEMAHQHPAAALALAREVQQRAMSRQDDHHLGLAYYWQAYLLNLDTRLRSPDAPRLYLARMSAALLADQDEPEALAQAYTLLSRITYLAGMVDSAEHYLNQGLLLLPQLRSRADSGQVVAELLTWQGRMLAESPVSDQHRIEDALYTLAQARHLYQRQAAGAGLLFNWLYTAQIQAIHCDPQARSTLLATHRLARDLDSDLLTARAWQAQANSLLLRPGCLAASPLAALQEAAQATRQALALVPDAQARYHMGLVYHRLADWYAEEPHRRAVYLDSAASQYQLALNANLMEHQDPFLLQQIVGSYQDICQERQECEQVMSLVEYAYHEVVKEHQETQDRAQRRLYQFERARQAQQVRSARLRMLGGAAGLLLLLGGLFWVRYQRLHLARLRERITYRLETLQAQMNPHFISNSLNAIEALINVNRNRDASYYLIQFSRLSRLILTQSRKTQISLADEVKMLRYYLSLERLRLDERLTYEIEVAPNLSEQEVAMPPLLLQPLVENAIWHGIQPKAVGGHLHIRFDRPGPETLRCIVEDNGIGRARAQAMREGKRQTRESVSTDIIQERLAMLRRKNDVSLRYEDLYDAAGQPVGTRVELHLAWTPLIAAPLSRT